MTSSTSPHPPTRSSSSVAGSTPASSPATSASRLSVPSLHAGGASGAVAATGAGRARRARCTHGSRGSQGARHHCQPAAARGVCSREQTLRRRHAAAGTLREAALYEKGRRAHAHNAHVAEVAARAKVRRDRAAEEAREAVRRRQLEASERRERAAEELERRRRDVSMQQRLALRNTRSLSSVGRETSDPTGATVTTPPRSDEPKSLLELMSPPTGGPATADDHGVSSPWNNPERPNREELANVDMDTEPSDVTTSGSLGCEPGHQNLGAGPSGNCGTLHHDETSSDSTTGAQQTSVNSSRGTLRPNGRRWKGKTASSVAPAAARRIAGYWLLTRARRGLTDAGLLAPCRCAGDFEQTTLAVQSRVAGAAACLALRALGTNIRASRVLLASFVVALHHENVLDGNEEDERNALLTARRLVLCLQAGTLPALAHAWRDWLHAHATWKAKDKKRMTEAIVADAVATEALKSTLRKRFGGTSSGSGDIDAAGPIWEEQLTKKQNQLRRAIVELAGDDGVAALDAALMRARGMPDEHIAHEIMVDCDAFVNRFKRPNVPDDKWTALYMELCASGSEGLFFRLKNIEADLNAIHEGSFPVLRREDVQIDRSFAIRFVVRVADTLKELQAEAEDENLSSWLHDASQRLSVSVDLASTVVEVLRELTERVSALRETVSVTRVLMLAPIVQQHGVAWERSKFQDKITAGEISADLPKTRAFLSAALLQPGVDVAELMARNAHSVRRAMRMAMVQVCASSSAVDIDTAPEILSLDVARLVSIQNRLQRMTLLCVLDSIARQFLAGAVGSLRGISESYRSDILRSVLYEDLGMASIQEKLVSTVTSALRVASEDHGVTLTAEQIGLLHGLAVRGTRVEDPLFRLLFDRVVVRIQTILCTTYASSSSASSESSRGEIGVSRQAGVEVALSEIHDVASQLEKLAVHVYNVHGEIVVFLASDSASAFSRSVSG